MRSKSPSQRRQLVCFHSDTVFLTIYSNLLYSLYTHTLWKRSVQKYTSYGALSKTIHFLSVLCEAGVVQQSTEAQAGVVQDELIIPLELFIPPLYLYSPGCTVNWKYAILLKWMILSICRLFCASSWNKTSHQSHALIIKSVLLTFSWCWTPSGASYTEACPGSGRWPASQPRAAWLQGVTGLRASGD